MDWDLCYKKRCEMLQKLISQNAPPTIVERQCRLIRKAVYKTHNMLPVVLDDCRYGFLGLSLKLWVRTASWWLSKWKGISREDAAMEIISGDKNEDGNELSSS